MWDLPSRGTWLIYALHMSVNTQILLYGIKLNVSRREEFVICLGSVPHPQHQFMPNSLQKKGLLKTSRAVQLKRVENGTLNLS